MPLTASGALLPGVLALAVLGFVSGAWLVPIDPADPRLEYTDSRRVYDTDGRLLREAVNPDGFRAHWVDLDRISPALVAATLAVEDDRFYRHTGVDPIAVLRAAVGNLTGGQAFSGASTITMQVARLVFGHPRTLAGKIGQAWDALRVERLWSKDEVLEQYLNRAPYGSGCVGAEAASLRYLGKPSSHLSLAEAALLAGIPQSPTAFDPTRFPRSAEARRSLVLAMIERSGGATKADTEAARAQLPAVVASPPPIHAGHFTDLVLAATDRIGDIHTTLDGQLNDVVETVVADHVERYRDRGVTNAAAVVLDNTTGRILALVGSREWTDEEEGAVNGALAPRQPGSALKPFLYALAFAEGYTPATVLADVETEYFGTDRTLYIPMNYTRQYRGPVLAQEALAYSLNVPAVRLLQSIGTPVFLEHLRSLGFEGLEESADYYGLGLVLGNGEVTLLQMAAAYATLARGGLYLPPTPFPESWGAPPAKIYDEPVAWLVTSILADEEMRAQAFGQTNPLILGYPMAVKTGTSNEWRDVWTIGYNTRYTVAVWAGSFQAFPMDHMSGSIGAGTLFHRIADVLAERDPRPSELPRRPEGIVSIAVCSDSGLRPTDACPGYTVADVLAESPRDLCDVHRRVRVDTRNGMVATESTPERYVVERVVAYLPPVFHAWMEANGYPQPPTEGSPLGSGVAGSLVIRKPRPGDVYIIEPGYERRTQTISLEVEADPAVRSVTWYVDGRRVSTVGWPFEGIWVLQEGEHTVEARPGDTAGPRVRFVVR